MATGESKDTERIVIAPKSKGSDRIVIAPKGGNYKDWKKLEEILGGDTCVLDVPLRTQKPSPDSKPKEEEKKEAPL